MDLFQRILEENGYTYTGEGYIASITTPLGVTLSSGDNGSMSGWMYAVNGKIASVSADQYLLKEGDEVVWFYTDDASLDDRIENWETFLDPDAALPSYAAQWEGFRGGSENSAVLRAETPKNQAEAALKWKYTLKDVNDWSTAISDPVMVNGNWYYAVGSEIVVINQDGEKVGSGALAGAIDYTCRPVYTEGLVIVPLSQGRLQALAADSLKTVWLTDPVTTQDNNGQPETHQSLTTLTVNGGCVYMGTAVADWSTSYRGIYQCVDVKTGQIIWRNQNDSAGRERRVGLCGGRRCFNVLRLKNRDDTRRSCSRKPGPFDDFERRNLCLCSNNRWYALSGTGNDRRELYEYKKRFLCGVQYEHACGLQRKGLCRREPWGSSGLPGSARCD